MKNNPLDQHRQQLLLMRDQLLARIRAQRGGAVGRADAAAEHFTREQDSSAQLQTGRETEMALDAHEISELQEIDDALARLHQGEYGDCIDCGQSIAAARLQAQPSAARCLPCQNRHEHQRTQA